MTASDLILKARREEGTYWVVNHGHPSNPTNISNVDARLGLLVQGEDEVYFTPGQALESMDWDGMMLVTNNPIEDWDITDAEDFLVKIGRAA